MVISFFRKNCSVYEIYPQTETPRLTLIARLDFGPDWHFPAHLLPGTVIWFGAYHFAAYGDKTFFMVWDYRLNHSISFFVDVDILHFGFEKVYFVLSKSLQ
jgi:hypothetical protein